MPASTGFLEPDLCMKIKPLVATVIIVLTLLASAQAQKIGKESIRFEDKNRTFYLFVPETSEPSSRMPVIVLLHGSGRNGLSLVERWRDLAKREGVMLAGPDSLNSEEWRTKSDGPDFIYALVENLKAKYPIDARRIYLFGHSAGAIQAISLSLLESEYFAATAVHAGSLAPNMASFVQRAKRKIPISIFVGTNDESFPLSVVRSTRDTLNSNGFNSELTEIKGHTHSYYDRAEQINLDAWTFLRKHELKSDPKFEKYRFESAK